MKLTRILPLVGIMALGCVVLLLRLYQVQVKQHDIWAQEALGLTYSGFEIPYRRGRIRDTHGKVLARSKSTNHVALLYREFRREHALGQLAHSRSLLEQRAVGLPEARRERKRWARELLELTPADLERFARGKAVRLGSLEFAATQDARALNRPRRAKDIGFYARYLLHLDKKSRGRLEKLARDKGKQKSFLELAVEVLGQRAREGDKAVEVPRDAEALMGRVLERIERFDQRLGQLAALLFEPAQLDAGESPLERLVRELEEVRRWVEDQTASKLFSEATQFVAGRVEPQILLENVDLDWIARLLAWDDARLAEWAQGARQQWRQSWLRGYALPRLLVQLQLSPRPGGALPDDFLARMAGLFRVGDVVQAGYDDELADWRAAAPELAVLGDLQDLFQVSYGADLEAAQPVMPFQQPELIQSFPQGSRDWSLLRRFWMPDPQSPGAEFPGAERLERWVTNGGYSSDPLLAKAALAFVHGWDALLQHEISKRLGALRASAKPSQLSPSGRLVINEDWRERAAERAEYFLKDYGQRPRSLVSGEPAYEVIYRLTRYAADYPGFFAREAPKREYLVLEGDRARIAPQLIGGVSSVSIKRLVRQRSASEDMAELKSNPDKSKGERERLHDLVGFVELPDEVRGFQGVEGFWNPELSGLNGFREVHGLDSLEAGHSRSMTVREQQDGKDLTLTLDSVLQHAVQETLRHPWDGGDPNPDADWYREPVGGIVLLSAEGDILAAVSEPDASDADPGALRFERQIDRERTFRAPTFQPPGSVFKPFVAAYALSQLGLDSSLTTNCGLNDKGQGGYKQINCHKRSGHGELDLYHALIHSCNAYFARLGETMSEYDLRAVCKSFGFGQPTGVKAQVQDRLGRTGFVEDLGGITSPKRLGKSGLTPHQRMMVGNGLGEVVVTPVQLARATLALAQGKLIDLRLVRRIGDGDLPFATQHELGLRSEALEEVRVAMRGVATEGSAKAALRPAVLGLDVAAKTGSADLVGGKKNASGRSVKVRKHTWVIGWLPYEKPELVFVVFVHDTRQTSSHGAIYIAQQLLQQPAVLDWLDGRGVDTQAARELGARRR